MHHRLSTRPPLAPPSRGLPPRARRPGRLGSIAIALLIAWAVALLIARPAEAGTYTVTQCGASNPSLVEARWERSSDHYRPRARCGSGEGLQAYHDAERTGPWHYGAWVWRAPAGTVFTHVQANASLTYQAGHRGQLIATRPDGAPVEFGSEHNDFRVHSIGGEFTQFHSWLRCVAPATGQPCGRAGSDSAHAYVRGVFLRTLDRAAPALSLTGGSVIGDRVVRGVRGLTLAAGDTGGGIRTVTLRANGILLSTDVRNCAVVDGFATALRPCPAATTGSLAVPTAHAAFATGPNPITACVEDLALDGFPNADCERRALWVDNVCPASAVDGGMRVEAAFAPGRDRVRSDETGLVSGRVPGAGAGATVCALSRDRVAGAPIVVAATATTDAEGSYEIELPPGPSRDVFVHYVVGDRVHARHGLTLISSARPTLGVTPNRRVRPGKRLHFAGRLPGPACTDRVVKVQARIGKRRWQVFRTDRTDGACAFAARYKLRGTRVERRYLFRALVPQQAGYPYERGYSALARVWVTPKRR
jgi:hypothetical protein